MEKSQEKNIYEKLVDMGKKYPIPLWTILLTLVTALGSLTWSVVKGEDKEIKQDIVKVENRVTDLEKTKASIVYVDKSFVEHEAKQQLQFEKIILAIENQSQSIEDLKKMTNKLLDRELNN